MLTCASHTRCIIACNVLGLSKGAIALPYDFVVARTGRRLAQLFRVFAIQGFWFKPQVFCRVFGFKPRFFWFFSGFFPPGGGFFTALLVKQSHLKTL